MEKIQVKINQLLESRYLVTLGILALLTFFFILFIDKSNNFLFYENQLIEFYIRAPFDISSFLESVYPLRDLFLQFFIKEFEGKLSLYRFLNLIIHAGNSVLIYFALKRFGIRFYTLLSLLFLVSPMHVFALSTVEGMDILLATSLGLLSFHFYTKQVDKDQLFNLYNILAFIMYAASVLTHYAYFCLPFLYLMYGNFKGALSKKEQVIKLLPFWVLLFARLITYLRYTGFYQVESIQAQTQSFMLILGARINHAIELMYSFIKPQVLYSFESLNIYSFLVACTFLFIIFMGLIVKSRKINILSKVILVLLIPLTCIKHLEYAGVSPYVDKQFYLLSFLILIYFFEWMGLVYAKIRNYLGLIISLYIVIGFFVTLDFRNDFNEPSPMYREILHQNPYNAFALYKLIEFELSNQNFDSAQKAYSANEAFLIYYPRTWRNEIDLLREEWAKRKGESPRP